MKRLFTALVFLFAISGRVPAGQTGAAPTTLEGQIVCCTDCWAKADRKTVPYGTGADIAQAARCIAKGDPTLLAVMDAQGTTTFYQLEIGQYKRSAKNWLDYVGDRVRLTGVTHSKKQVHYIKVDQLTVLSAPEIRAEMPAQAAIGADAEIVLKDLFGAEQRLSSYRGRIVVLNFWATYCIPCRKEMPDLAAIQNQYAAFGVQVIGAAADDLTAVPKVRAFIKEAKVNFPVWLGSTAADMERFGLGSALPGTLVIGRDGKIVASIRGVIKPAELRSQLEKLLAQAQSKGPGPGAVAEAPPGKASSVPS
jgi:thiol-disulfide isomerase/thioredoxin